MLGLIPANDSKQALRIKRIVFSAVSAGVVHALLLFVAFELGFVRGERELLFGLFAVIWLGHACVYLFIRFGYNLNFKDPSMTLPLLVWSSGGLLATAYYVDTVRLCVMVMVFALLLMGSFRLLFWDFIKVSLFTIIGYFSILVLVEQNYPEKVDFTAEMIQWLAYSMLTLVFAVISADISQIRVKVTSRNRQLSHALSRIQEMAITDDLTGIYNRRYAMELLAEQKGLSDRGAYNFSVCYADLDNFKRVNDNFGHNVGDIVLKRFVSVVAGELSSLDYFCRFGGEEFLIVLVKVDSEQAVTVVEKIRQAVEGIDMTDVHEDLSVSASFGVSDYHVREDVNQLLMRADTALYKAKEQGRNCVVRDA